MTRDLSRPKPSPAPSVKRLFWLACASLDSIWFVKFCYQSYWAVTCWLRNISFVVGHISYYFRHFFIHKCSLMVFTDACFFIVMVQKALLIGQFLLCITLLCPHHICLDIAYWIKYFFKRWKSYYGSFFVVITIKGNYGIFAIQFLTWKNIYFLTKWFYVLFLSKNYEEFIIFWMICLSFYMFCFQKQHKLWPGTVDNTQSEFSGCVYKLLEQKIPGWAHHDVGQWRGMQRTNSQCGCTGLPVAFSGFKGFTVVRDSDKGFNLSCTKENILYFYQKHFSAFIR